MSDFAETVVEYMKRLESENARLQEQLNLWRSGAEDACGLRHENAALKKMIGEWATQIEELCPNRIIPEPFIPYCPRDCAGTVHLIAAKMREAAK